MHNYVRERECNREYVRDMESNEVHAVDETKWDRVGCLPFLMLADVGKVYHAMLRCTGLSKEQKSGQTKTK